MSTRYWLSTWDWDSWLVFQGLQPQMIGLKKPVDVAAGDVLLNYVKQAGRVPGQWVSAERVTGPYIVDSNPIYSGGVWQYRWPVEPVSPRFIAGDGIVGKDVAGAMDLFGRMTEANWGGPLRTNGREISQHDGEMLVGMLRARVPADPSASGVAMLPRAQGSAGKTRRDIPPGLRYKILKRDNFRCVKCGRSPATDPAVQLQVDHKLSWSNGGDNSEANLQTLCSDCNLGKSNRHDD